MTPTLNYGDCARSSERARIETDCRPAVTVSSVIAPAHQSGRGLQLMFDDAVHQFIQIAPAHQSGRGLKLYVPKDHLPDMKIAPAHQSGRGLKHDRPSGRRLR